MGKIIDLTGREFGRLTVLSLTDRKVNRGSVWRCQCSCGNIVEVPAIALVHNRTKSCGCLRKEQLKGSSNVNKLIQAREKDSILGTNVKRLCTKPSAANTSGVVGVSYDKSKNMWEAYIYFQGSRHRLGLTHEKNEAIKLRKEA